MHSDFGSVRISCSQFISANQYTYIAMFLFKSSYVGQTRARQILGALGALV
ncbi:MAG: hypothetical protein HY318_19285 [Armatimonadetes bacterium]|nr:hypothetical protein [Armatimonadota bacterium]